MSLAKLYMTPGSCTTGIHILLQGDHETVEYLQLNPKSSIPMHIREDGTVLTEFQAIAWWLRRSYPKAALRGNSIDDEVRIMEVMDYVVDTLHMQGFARIFTTDKFSPNPMEHADVKRQGRQIVDKCFDVLDRMLVDKDFVVDSFSIADAAVFYTEFWADRTDIP